MKRTMHINGDSCQAENTMSAKTWPIRPNRFWKRALLFVCCGMMAASGFGQQALGQRPRVKSPVVNAAKRFKKVSNWDFSAYVVNPVAST